MIKSSKQNQRKPELAELLTHPAQIDQVDSKNKDLGSSYMIKEKVIKILQLIVGVAKYCSVSMRCPKFRFPIWVIGFVSQRE